MLVLLGGCANKAAAPVVSLPNNAACPADVSLSDAKPLAYDPEDTEAINLRITLSSPCVMGANGAKGLYDVVALPDPGIGYYLSVGSYPAGDAIFAPRVQMLGQDRTVLREIPRSDFIYRGNVLTAVFRVHAGEHYLVVRSDTATVGQGESRIEDKTHSFPVVALVPGAALVGGFAYGTTSLETQTYSLTGTVKVVITPSSAAR
ncbi:MAG: hypothetical protein ACOH12_05590 [Parvibaculaceae bacterium]